MHRGRDSQKRRFISLSKEFIDFFYSLPRIANPGILISNKISIFLDGKLRGMPSFIEEGAGVVPGAFLLEKVAPTCGHHIEELIVL
jgi:hypothetical protein